MKRFCPQDKGKVKDMYHTLPAGFYIAELLDEEMPFLLSWTSGGFFELEVNDASIVQIRMTRQQLVSLKEEIDKWFMP